jgi:hypothetical protein
MRVKKQVYRHFVVFCARRADANGRRSSRSTVHGPQPALLQQAATPSRHSWLPETRSVQAPPRRPLRWVLCPPARWRAAARALRPPNALQFDEMSVSVTNTGRQRSDDGKSRNLQPSPETQSGGVWLVPLTGSPDQR